MYLEHAYLRISSNVNTDPVRMCGIIRDFLKELPATPKRTYIGRGVGNELVSVFV